MRLDAAAVPALLQEAGVVGAGGAGFPTYVKFQQATEVLLANGTESEPGFYGDKLLMQTRPALVWGALRLLKETMGHERVVLAVKRKHIPYAAELVRHAERTGDHEMAYVADKYILGEETALIRATLGREVPKDGLPSDVGVTVDNIETLANVYRALADRRPVTRKLVQVLTDRGPQPLLDAPIGTPARTIWRLLGHDPESFADDHKLVDGGPLLGVQVAPLEHVVQRCTNGLLAWPEDDFKERRHHVPAPSFEPPQAIEAIVDQVNAVEVPLGGRCLEPARPCVEEGDPVGEGDVIATARPDALSVHAHASIPGVVTAVRDDHVRIERA